VELRLSCLEQRFDPNLAFHLPDDIVDVPVDLSYGLPDQIFGSLIPYARRSDTSDPDVVIDLRTNLMWENAARPILPVAGAIARCEDLTFEGHTDWRLPSRLELATAFLSFDPYAPSPEGLLSSTYAAGSTTEVWAFEVTTPFTTSAGRVMCVRGPALPSPRFSTPRAGIVVDAATGLTWERAPSGRGGPAAIQAHCSNLALDGGGFRVASIHELFTIYDDAADPPTAAPSLLVPAPTGPPDEPFLSSTPASSPFDPAPVWGYAAPFVSGTDFAANLYSSGQVWCVK
jgi:hypothetical protein